MEGFSSHLYEKYVTLKKRKFSEIEESNQRRVYDVLQYQSAMEQLVEDLKTENEKLRVVIVSLQEKYQESQKLLLEENHKTKMFSSEVETFKELLSQNNDNVGRISPDSPCRRPTIRLEDPSKFLPKDTLGTLPGKGAAQSENTAITPLDSHNENRLVPDCCRRMKTCSGNKTVQSCSPCAFHTLVELLVGMNFSVESHTEGLCFSVSHKMSGYNFTLCWVSDEDCPEGELAYRVSSLGTIENIALEWMKEDIVFSMAMCPVFFDRLSQVVGHK